MLLEKGRVIVILIVFLITFCVMSGSESDFATFMTMDLEICQFIDLMASFLYRISHGISCCCLLFLVIEDVKVMQLGSTGYLFLVSFRGNGMTLDYLIEPSSMSKSVNNLIRTRTIDV